MAQKRLEYNSHTFDIGYEIINPTAKNDIIILHGWGSNRALMKQSFSPFLADFRHIYIDLMGFGSSSSDAVLTTSDYAAIVDNFLSNISAKKDIILGHSFGGKVATLLNPKLLVLVASAGILVPKPFSVRVKIAIFKLFKNLGLSKVRNLFVSSDAKGLSQNMYETFKNVVDEDFRESFRAFKNRAVLCFGDSDTATPLWSGAVIEKLIENSKLYSFSGDHYFFMHHAKEICDIIESEYKEA